jgi:hypothetical protein
MKPTTRTHAAIIPTVRLAELASSGSFYFYMAQVLRYDTSFTSLGHVHVLSFDSLTFLLLLGRSDVDFAISLRLIQTLSALHCIV